MLTINKKQLETPLTIRLIQSSIRYELIVNTILDIINRYETDKRYSKNMCVNNISLTLFGLKDFIADNYIKLPVININTTDKILKDIVFTVEEYKFIKSSAYLNQAEKCFKKAVRDVMHTLNDIENSAFCRRQEFRYTYNSLKDLLDDNVVLEHSVDITKIHR